MATIERGTALVQKVIGRLKKRPGAKEAVGASPKALDQLESKLLVELPPTLRLFLSFDFTFVSLGKKFEGRHRFGKDPAHPEPKLTSVRKLAEAKTNYGTDSRLRGKVVRLPNLPGEPWNALYLGESRRDGELVILGIDDDDETNVRVFPRYTAFDLYLADQAGLVSLRESTRLDDLESHIELNPELGTVEEEEEETDY